MPQQHKKAVLWGAIFGAVLMPFATLGLAIRFVELVAVPFTILPRYAVNLLIDVSSARGAVSLGIGIVASIILYAILGYVLS